MDNVLLTFEQFEKINTGLEIREDGMTNKKCPICGGNVIIKYFNSSSSITCDKKECFSISCRGI